MPASTHRTRVARSGYRALVPLVLALGALLACTEGDRPSTGAAPMGKRHADMAWVEIVGERFALELATTAMSRQRGLSGRTHIPRNGGMLFVNPRSSPSAMVMRDCPIPIDVAFLDDGGRVVALHAMHTEPPRRDGESAAEYEARLPQYPSGVPARFAIETAGGRLAELGLAVGDRVVLDARSLAARAR